MSREDSGGPISAAEEPQGEPRALYAADFHTIDPTGGSSPADDASSSGSTHPTPSPLVALGERSRRPVPAWAAAGLALIVGGAGFLAGSSTPRAGGSASTSSHRSASTATVDTTARATPCPVITSGIGALVQNVETAVGITVQAPHGRAGTLISITSPGTMGLAVNGSECTELRTDAATGSQIANGLQVPASGGASGRLLLTADCSVQTVIVKGTDGGTKTGTAVNGTISIADGATITSHGADPTTGSVFTLPDLDLATMNFKDQATGTVQTSKLTLPPALQKQFNALTDRCDPVRMHIAGAVSEPSGTTNRLIDVPLGASYADPPEITQMSVMMTDDSNLTANTSPIRNLTILMRAPTTATVTLSLLKPVGSPVGVTSTHQPLTVPPGAWRDFSVELFWPRGHCTSADLTAMQVLAAGGLQPQAILVPVNSPNTAVVLHSVPGWDQNQAAHVLRNAYRAACG
jgi:hypothetical protein